MADQHRLPDSTPSGPLHGGPNGIDLSPRRQPPPRQRVITEAGEWALLENAAGKLEMHFNCASPWIRYEFPAMSPQAAARMGRTMLAWASQHDVEHPPSAPSGQSEHPPSDGVS